jgi:hypothetical protein
MSPVTGFLYSDVVAPLTATSSVGASKMGTATCQSVLGIIAQGDCSIATAANSAGITRITYIDYRSTSMLGLIASFTIRVYGE